MHKQVFLSLFVCSFLFLVVSYFPGSVPDPLLIVFFILILGIALKFLGKESAIVFGAFSAIYFVFMGVENISTLYLHMSFLSFSLYFLWDKRAQLIQGCGSIQKRIGYGIMIFALMIFASVLANAAIRAAGIDDQEKVLDTISSLPLYLLIMAFTLGPISEELFFRAFLVPRVGVPVSTILFTITHVAYGSTAELVGVFFLGFILANAYFFLRDPLPCIIAHALFNLFSVMLILWVF